MKALLRPFAAALIVISVAFATGVATISPTVAVTNGRCVDDTGFYQGFGQYNWPNKTAGGNIVFGVRAAFVPTSNFRRCSGTTASDGAGHGASSAWVAVVNTAHQEDILQIGVVDCNDGLSDGCPKTNPVGNLNYFYAYGYNCSGTVVPPLARYLGAANRDVHTFSVVITSGNVLNMYIDGVLKFAVPLGNKCWVNDPVVDTHVHFVMSGEVEDHGDGLGADSSRSLFYNVVRQLSKGGSWVDAAMGTCTDLGDTHTNCNLLATDRMQIWTN
jgi:hypothetical protein